MSGAFPWGWFSAGFVRELKPGAAMPATVNGRELAIFRGASGGLVALDAHCPHLGAHMGHGGTVEGDTLRCHFHGFCFDGKGACTRTGYGTRVPPRARVRAYPVVDFGGVLAVWYDPDGRAPLWTPEFPDRAGWSAPLANTWVFEGRPQEIAENAVDLGHLSIAHGYGAPRIHGEARFEGPVLRTEIRFGRPLPIYGRRGPTVENYMRITQHGVGLASVETLTPKLGIEARFVVSSASLDPVRVVLRTTAMVRSQRHNERLGRLRSVLPTGLVDALVGPLVRGSFAGDIAQDLPIWRHKRFLEHPALAEGDGPVGRYRSWAKQFYRPPHGHLAVVSDDAMK